MLSYKTNDWTNSYLREFLNDYYYEGKAITCHSDSATAWVEGLTAKHETITCPDINKINSIAKGMIQKSLWYLGGTTYKTSSAPYETYTVNELYESERGIKVYNKHATTSTDYIGLIYPSDYGYASTDESCRQNLRTGAVYDNNIWGGTPTCINGNWLYKSGVWYWTISPYLTYSYYVFDVRDDGSLYSRHAFYYYSVRPSLYLKSNVKIVSGSGTKDNMFKLEI
ncbi:MAG: hypothetical protein Q4C38_03810 [bacterium]|nr:hypothetical protein [bacterium]